MTKARVYTTPFCPACRELKQELRKCGVEFEELDVTTNDEATRKLIERKIMAVPVVEIDGEFTIGYKPGWARERFKC